MATKAKKNQEDINKVSVTVSGDGVMNADVRGVKLSLDLGDLNAQDRVRQATGIINKIEEELETHMEGKDADAEKTLEILGRRCDAINEYFDTIFGAGTSEEIFHGLRHVRINADVCADFCNKVDRAVGRFIEKSTPMAMEKMSATAAK